MRILVTGGSGFIGSNLVDYLLNNSNVEFVRVLDNLSTGSIKNLYDFRLNPKLDIMIGDMADRDVCNKACQGIDLISCQAALGSVPRSMKTPLSSHHSNVNAFIVLLETARQCGIKRIVYASSSSVYGHTKNVDDLNYCHPVSFYGMTKHVNDLYASFYTKYFDMECIGLRYHNVFGDKQKMKGEYCAVIPIFISRCLQNLSIDIHGDGKQYRDFTHVDNVIHANMLALTTTNADVFGMSIDIGSNTKVSVLELADSIIKHTSSNSNKVFVDRREGDIFASCAVMDTSRDLLGYFPVTSFDIGLIKTIKYYNKCVK